MKFYLPEPVLSMTEKEKEIWRKIYFEQGRPEGHLISASEKGKQCYCRTCNEFRNYLNGRQSQ